MIAGGLGNVRRRHVEKKDVVVGAPLVVLGGPAMLIGLGGGAASSVGSGQSASELDFASVQRGNPEIQRRAQEVIDRCWALGDRNPIQLIHDVGAGGLSNAVPEAVAHSQRGGAHRPARDPERGAGMSPMEIWCNEAQERYVLALAPGSRRNSPPLCERERCPFAVVGEITGDGRLLVTDPLAANAPVRHARRRAARQAAAHAPRRQSAAEVRAGPVDEPARRSRTLLDRVLRLPTVADKTFLITIGDRTVGGLISRDQMVGPWQVPVADVAVTLERLRGLPRRSDGGRRAHAGRGAEPAGLGRLAVAEAVTNLLAADVRPAAGHPAVGQLDGGLRRARRGRRAVRDGARRRRANSAPELGITIPVGKDSLSMKTAWSDAAGEHAGGRAGVADRLGVRAGRAMRAAR